MKIIKFFAIIGLIATFTAIDACKTSRMPKAKQPKIVEAKTDLKTVSFDNLEKEVAKETVIKNTEITDLRKKIESLQANGKDNKNQLARVEAKLDLVLKEIENQKLKNIENLILMKELMMAIKK